ncbi:hypothetical protein KFK09_018454 [Dendrobium nobile]|uniref:Uncharacterized protein n=1 Tax=Dendrobium nobile TaxID=94219 RepID=A0A8T3B192_DENNO|nr:hypothetical protein KFK09_018454 [Dendrobium nobile]
MAEPNSPVIHSPTTKNPASDLPAQKNNPPPKILSSFLYKAIIFAICIALLPLFPSQMPESANPTFLSRTWELLHLLLVGIAISYGLFSRRNADHDFDKDKEKDAAFKSDTNSYVSRILHISSAFDDEDSKAETWSSQYHRADPVIVESKPLLLPVRSLKKSRVQNSDSLGSSSAVLSSPIPWKSRSGRMEAIDDCPAMNDASPTPSYYATASSFSSNEHSISDKSFHVAYPPPPPPPPPSFSHGSLISTRREVKKSFKDELKDLSIKGREGFLKNSSLDSSPPRSVRTVRAKEAQSTESAPALQQHKYQTETKKKKKKVEFMEKMIVMSDDSESEKASDSSDVEEAVHSSAEVRAEAEENEVDKKADEFIAKFREQIRLQRIESIKKSSGHRAVKNTK